MQTAYKALTPVQRREYDENGFVVVPDVFPLDELEALDREIDHLVSQSEDIGRQRPGWLFKVAERSDVTRALARDERILRLIEHIVQPGIAIHSTKLVAKVPHSDIECHWHQDEAFYMKLDDPTTHSKTRMSAWVPLQSADERNGCLWMVPGSHKWGLEDYHMVDYGACRRVIDREAYANEHAIPVPVRAGSVVLFNAWTWHQSRGNQTDQVRRAFIISYQEATTSRRVDGGHGGGQGEIEILRPAN